MYLRASRTHGLKLALALVVTQLKKKCRQIFIILLTPFTLKPVNPYFNSTLLASLPRQAAELALITLFLQLATQLVPQQVTTGLWKTPGELPGVKVAMSILECLPELEFVASTQASIIHSSRHPNEHHHKFMK